MTVFRPPERLVVAGQGYVGLPLALRAVEVGFDVVGIDSDQDRIKRLSTGESYLEVVEPNRLAAALTTGRYHPTTDYDQSSGFDYAVIAVPSPLKEGVPDLTCISGAAHSLAGHVRSGCCVVLESTTYPGTTEELVGPILESESGLVAGTDFYLGYSPERIDPGNRHWHLGNTPKVVSGVSADSLSVIEEFYGRLVAQTVPVSSPAVAELSKLIENTFRHVNIALVNELAMFASDLGIDVWEALDASATKPFGFMRFDPGPGVGGHCLPIDPSFLSWRVRRRLGHTFRFVELANDVNAHMPEYVVRRLVAGLNRRHLAMNGSRILLLGLAYKRNSGDARESPSLSVAERLIGLGAEVVAADPLVSDIATDCPIERVEATVAEARSATAVVLLTDHDAFDLPPLVAASRYFFDARHRAHGSHVEYL